MATPSERPKWLCKRADCTVSTTGKCLEGLDPENCPNVQMTGNGAHDSPNVLTAPDESYLALRDAERLGLEAAESVLRMDETQVVALVGPKDAGKTSLIACLFELFQRGPLDSLTFGGSATLRAFERACHQARAASRRSTPDTERTSHREGVGFFHIRLTGGRTALRSLLIADRAGESYRKIIDNLDNAAPLVEVSRADIVTLLIDGGRLSDIDRRHQLRSETTQILSALVESGLTRKQQRLALVLTKFDQIDQVSDKDRVSRDLASLLAQLQSFATHFCCCRTFETAASPTGGSVRRGHGLSSLAAYWMESVHAPTEASFPDVFGPEQNDRMQMGEGRMFWQVSASAGFDL
mgnify:CR=1 FL=1